MVVETTAIIVAIIGAIGTITGGVLNYRNKAINRKLSLENKEQLYNKSVRELKLIALAKLFNFKTFNVIRDSVDRIFDKTNADRFLIWVGINGKTDFRVVSVIFEQHKHKKYRVNALVTYRDVVIDDSYRTLLKKVEVEGALSLNLKTMNVNILKNFYIIEKVKAANLQFLTREKLNDDHDMVIYASLATHSKDGFNDLDCSIFKTEYEGTIIHALKNADEL